jgi:WD40-like Beta Propeller Repeat
MELSLAIPAGRQIYTDDGPAIVVPPDGSRIAYVAGTPPQTEIYVRELDKSDATRLEGAHGAALFFSPDGQWIGFFSMDGKPEKISVFGGAPVVLANSDSHRGAAWSEDGTICSFLTTRQEALSELHYGFERPARVGGGRAAIDVPDDSLLVYHECHALRYTEETQHAIEF